MSFLPADYKEPVTSNYMDFEEGDNTFRVLGSAKVGWEYWTNKMVEGKLKGMPTRVTEEDTIPMGEVLEGKYGLQVYFFWAFPVYNFKDQRIQILTIKQKKVRRGMMNYINNPKWGDPQKYNFVVTKEVTERTDYMVSVEPKEELSSDVIKKYKAMNIDMDVWMAGKDPFKATDEVKESAESYDEADEVADDVPF